MGDEQPANQNHRSVLSCFAGAADVLAEHCRHWETNPAPFAMGRGGFGPQKAHSWGASPPYGGDVSPRRVPAAARGALARA